MVVVVSFVSQDAGAPRRIPFLKDRPRAIGLLMSGPVISNSTRDWMVDGAVRCVLSLSTCQPVDT